MKICIAQTHSLKGKVDKNIENHLRIIGRAIESHSDLVIFPELSITNYEPQLAAGLATNVENALFDPFQELSDRHSISIGLGMPTKSEAGLHISMLIFQPNSVRTVYSKQMLHSDELPYFAAGIDQTILRIQGKNIAIGICYEALQREHFLSAKARGADIYIASVAKSQKGIEKANAHFSGIAKEFRTPVLMSNCIGPCDDFHGAGQSAVWNKNGDLVVQVDNRSEGVIIYDTESEHVVINTINKENVWQDFSSQMN
jgi:predicted amidohydrolase